MKLFTPVRKFLIQYGCSHICPFIFSSPSAEESEPRASCGDKAQQPSQETAGEQAEEAKAEGSAEEAAG